ncbi:hypothetical protein L7F22_049872 [Adiantum nelumboides]|nr:hypothetical protein [Adiantum nelumboides]
MYPGSPIKFRTPTRLFEFATSEETSVYKARKIDQQESLCAGEVFITHMKSINTNSDCLLALAKLGISEGVLVSEALLALLQEVDLHFQSLYRMSEYAHDAARILGSVGVKKGFRFGAFAHGILQACKGKAESDLVYADVQRSGVALFWRVLLEAAQENADNEAFQCMANPDAESEFDILLTWSSLFDHIQQRNKASHPFSFIGSDVQFVEDALEVLKFVIQEEESLSKYGAIYHLINATVPMLCKLISTKKVTERKLKKEAASENEIARERLPKKTEEMVKGFQ